MTTNTGLTADQLNHKISETMESMPTESQVKLHSNICYSIKMAWFRNGWEPYWQPLAWIQSDEANCRLLDEMIEYFPYFSTCHADQGFHWEFEASGRDVKENFALSRIKGDRRTAIALAWLRWKGADCA